MTNHVIEPELAGGIPRRVAYTASAQRTRRWLWNFFATLFFVGLWAARVNTSFYERLAAEGVRNAPCTITDRDESHDEGDTYRLWYQYTAAEALYSGRVRVHRADYDSTPIGARCIVTYQPGAPNHHVFGSMSERKAQAKRDGWTIAIGFIAVIGALSIASYESRLRSRARILEYGDAVGALVEDRKMRSDGEGGATYYLTYRYPLSVGGTATITRTVFRSQYEALEKGDMFTVLRYSDSGVERTIPYFSLAEAEIVGSARADS